eukprot:scaffold5064_cov121-Cylindrotheca_fusiformis.AAC.13
MWEEDIEQAPPQLNETPPAASKRRRVFHESTRSKYLHGSLTDQINETMTIADTKPDPIGGGKIVLPCCILLISCFALFCLLKLLW